MQAEKIESDKRFPKAAVAMAVAGLLLASSTFVVGMIVGASNTGTAIELSKPNPNCFAPSDLNSYVSEAHVESVVIACQVTGMTEPEAIAYIESKGRSWRLASRDGEGFALTEDFTEARVNLEIYYHIVVAATAW